MKLRHDDNECSCCPSCLQVSFLLHPSSRSFFLSEETSSGPGTTADAGRFIHDEDAAAGFFMALDFSGLGQHPSFLLGAHAFSK